MTFLSQFLFFKGKIFASFVYHGITMGRGMGHQNIMLVSLGRYMVKKVHIYLT